MRLSTASDVIIEFLGLLRLFPIDGGTVHRGAKNKLLYCLKCIKNTRTQVHIISMINSLRGDEGK